jgi:hypothetical protein
LGQAVLSAHAVAAASRDGIRLLLLLLLLATLLDRDRSTLLVVVVDAEVHGRWLCYRAVGKALAK